jgi:hypothetical protein
MLLIVNPQKLNKCLFDYFYLPICPWMEFGIFLQLGVHLFPKCSPKRIEKYGIPILDDVLWYPKVHPYLFKEHVCWFLSFDGVFTRHKSAHLIEPVIY